MNRLKKTAFLIFAVSLVAGLTSCDFVEVQTVRAEVEQEIPRRIIRIPPNEEHPIPGSYSAVADGKNWGVEYHFGSYDHRVVKERARRPVYVYVFDTANGSDHALLQRALEGINHTDYTPDITNIDVNGHGTHVAGIIGADDPHVGLAYGLLSVGLLKIKMVKLLDNEGGGNLSWGREAYRAEIEDAKAKIQSGAFVIFNNSWAAGIGRIPELDEMMEEAYRAGIYLTCASGNFGGLVETPANIVYTQAIGALNQEGELTDWSARGQSQSFATAGNLVYSTIPNNQFAYWSGTSMASPGAAAIAAIAASIYPDLNAFGLADYLRQVARDAGSQGKDELFGHGIPIIQKIIDTPPSSLEINDTPIGDIPSEDPAEHVTRTIEFPLGYIGHVLYGTGFDPSAAAGAIALNDVVIRMESDRRAEYLYKNVLEAAKAFTHNRGIVINEDHDFCDAIHYAGRFLEAYFHQNNLSIEVAKIKGFVIAQGVRYQCQHFDINRFKTGKADFVFDPESNVYEIEGEVAYGPLSEPLQEEVVQAINNELSN